MPTKSPLWVGRVPAVTGTHCCLANDPAMAAERALYKRYQEFFDIPNESRGAA